jgi:glucoamylase
VGERAHYALAAGKKKQAEQLLRAMEAFANDSGLLSEQVWDSPDIPDRDLFYGRPSGSAMPLVWAHAEYVKLRRSLRDGRVFDTPPQTAKRYVEEKTGSPYATWRFNNKLHRMQDGKVLRVETLAAATVHWSVDGWQTASDAGTRDTGLGVYIADLPTKDLRASGEVVFTFHWQDADRWEGRDFSVTVM